ncbi:MAG: NAD-dependent DNA ligase LigA, partial [Bacteroidales bacterium]|nr:NAD-dependent DNA ligase LigA [Bacteroidales bacterium]
NIIKGINDSKDIPFHRVLYALGVRYVGITTAKKIAFHFLNMPALMSATYEQLLEVEEVGEKIARSVVEYMAHADRRYEIGRLEFAGIQMEEKIQKLPESDNKLNGKSFVVSGVFERSRDEIKQLIERFGGKNVSALSAKTNFLLAGEKMGPAKRTKAEKLKIQIISESDFDRLIS